VRLQLFASGGRDIVDETLPAIAYDRTTKSGWKDARGVWRYRDPRGVLVGGTSLITIRAQPNGRTVRVTVRARKAQLLVDSTDGPLRLCDVARVGGCGRVRRDRLHPRELPREPCGQRFVVPRVTFVKRLPTLTPFGAQS